MNTNSNATPRGAIEIRGPGGVRPVELMKRAIKDYFDDDMPTYASAIAFQALFSLFPFILFLTALLGYLRLGSFFDWLQEVALSMVPAGAAGTVTEVIAGLQEQQGELLSLGVLTALWVASAGVRVTMKAMNAAYEVGEGRSAWKRYALSIVYTVGIAVMIIAAAALLILGPQAMGWLARQAGLHDLFVAAWAWLRWPAAFLTLILAVAVIFHVAPNIQRRFRLITPGVLIAVVGWIVASMGFKYYANNFADYNAMYGSIGAIIVLLLYFFISAAALLFGAEVDAVIEHASRQGMESTAKGAGQAAPSAAVSGLRD